ncbi:hypothetical protein SprV_0401456000 [Sparganum proliferum]
MLKSIVHVFLSFFGALIVFFGGNAPEDVIHVELNSTGLSPKDLIGATADFTGATAEGLCRSFDATFAKTAEPQTLRLYTDFVPDRVRIGDMEVNLRENDCTNGNQVYSCRLIQVHESGFWSFEIDGIVTANLENVVLSSDSKYIPPIAIRALPLADKVGDNIFFRSSAPFVMCPRLEQKGVDVDFVFPASILDQSVKVSFYVDWNIQCEIGEHPIRKCENEVHDSKRSTLRISLHVTRFQAPSKRYRTVSAIVVQEETKKILTKFVDFGSTVWDPICNTYDGTFSFAQEATDITAYLPFKPQAVVIGHGYTFAKNKCQSEKEVLQCKLTNVPGSNIFKFEIFNVSKRDIETIHFSNSNVESPQFYILYRKLLTSFPQFLFSPEFSAPFVHCPSPSSYYTDVSCATFYKQPLDLTILRGNAVLCDTKNSGSPKCHMMKHQHRISVRQHVYKAPTMDRFVFITCELTAGDQKGYMTHLIDFGRKDAYEIGKEDIDETWAHLGLVYNGTYQHNSGADHFYAFMDFEPKYFRWFFRMDGERCIAGTHSFTCKIRKVIGSSFWRVEIRSPEALTASELSFQDSKPSPSRQYTMYSTPFANETKGRFLLKLSQPFVHHATNCSTISIRCAFEHKEEGEHVRFKVQSKYRTICGIGHRDLPPCKKVVFDTDAGTVTVTADVYKGDINGERYGIFTCQSKGLEDLHHEALLKLYQLHSASMGGQKWVLGFLFTDLVYSLSRQNKT